jgi:hypothetical protein
MKSRSRAFSWARTSSRDRIMSCPRASAHPNTVTDTQWRGQRQYQ